MCWLTVFFMKFFHDNVVCYKVTVFLCLSDLDNLDCYKVACLSLCRWGRITWIWRRFSWPLTVTWTDLSTWRTSSPSCVSSPYPCLTSSSGRWWRGKGRELCFWIKKQRITLLCVADKIKINAYLYFFRCGVKGSGKISWEQFLDKFQDPQGGGNGQTIPMRNNHK